MEKDIYILAIESSCDDTSAAVLRNELLLSNVTASQAVHESYGGVVPELASRAHQQNIVPVVHEAIKRAGIKKEQLSAVAFTRGPGLMGSLLVGVNFAKGFARSLGIPMIDVDGKKIYVGNETSVTIPANTKRLTVYGYALTYSIKNLNICFIFLKLTSEFTLGLYSYNYVHILIYIICNMPIYYFMAK